MDPVTSVLEPRPCKQRTLIVVTCIKQLYFLYRAVHKVRYLRKHDGPSVCILRHSFSPDLAACFVRSFWCQALTEWTRHHQTTFSFPIFPVYPLSPFPHEFFHVDARVWGMVHDSRVSPALSPHIIRGPPMVNNIEWILTLTGAESTFSPANSRPATKGSL